MTIQIEKILKTVRDIVPAGTRVSNPDSMRVVLDATLEVWGVVEEIWEEFGSSAHESVQDDIDAQIQEFLLRMNNYKGILDSNPENFGDVAEGLIDGQFSVLRHFPDVATPASISNQIASLEGMENTDVFTARAYEKFFKKLEPLVAWKPEEVASGDVPEGTPKLGRKLSTHITPELALAAVAGVAAIAWLFRGRKV